MATCEYTMMPTVAIHGVSAARLYASRCANGDATMVTMLVHGAAAGKTSDEGARFKNALAGNNHGEHGGVPGQRRQPHFALQLGLRGEEREH